MKTAIIIGATGLVGTQLVNLLLYDKRFDKIIVFGRRSLGVDHEKLKEHIINFDSPEEWQDLVKGDVFFSTLGTTIKQAKSKENQYKIDHTYQYNFAKAAAQNKVPVYVLVSAPNANADSKIFYTRIKGELERDIKKLTFESITILQPGLLHGDRNEKRIGESIAYNILKVLNNIGLARRYRPIHGKIVAKAMINTGHEANKGINTYTLNDVFRLAASINNN